MQAGRIEAESVLGRLKQAFGLEAGRTKVVYIVSKGRYEAPYKNEEKARKNARKMLKKYPGSEIRLSRTTLVEKEKRPFWRFGALKIFRFIQNGCLLRKRLRRIGEIQWKLNEIDRFRLLSIGIAHNQNILIWKSIVAFVPPLSDR